ncbi:MAG: MFS transporter [Candidatus Absconditabacteria bacterium]
MIKYKNLTLIIFLILVAGWSLLFGAFKFYYWASLQGTIQPSLELIAGYLSLGTGFAFLFAGALSYMFQEKYIIFGAGLSIAILTSFFSFFGLNSLFMFSILAVLVGVCYGVWSTVKNVLISTEIQKTGYSDTKVNSFVTIAFLIPLISGSIIGGYLFEKFGNIGAWYLGAFILIISFLALLLNYNNSGGNLDTNLGFKKAIKQFLPSLIMILKKHFKVMIYGGILLAIGTILAQKAIEMGVFQFHKTYSQAASLLGFTGIGTVFGSLLSVNMNTKRLFYFRLIGIVFAITIILFPLLVTNFATAIGFTFFAGVVFGILLNLIDGFIFLMFGNDNVKEYGSGTYGLVISITIALMMYISSTSNNLLGFNSGFYILGFLMLAIALSVEFEG